MTQDQTGVTIYDSQLLSKAQAAGLDLTPLLADIPEADDEAYVRVMQTILSAKTVDDLDSAWNGAGLDEFVDRGLIINGIRKMPSDFDEGLGMYLVLDCEIDANGTKRSLSTGSVNVVVQLVKAFHLNAFPLTVVPRKSKRPTTKGYYPMHLEIAR